MSDWDPIIDIMKDQGLNNLSVHDLKVMRANMINTGGFTKYEFARVQYWIMEKEGRNPFGTNTNQCN